MNKKLISISQEENILLNQLEKVLPPIRIVIADDFEEIQEKLERVVLNSIPENQHHRLDIHKFSNGLEVLNFLKRKQTVNLFILDIEMPIIDGEKVAKRLRLNSELSFYKNTPIFFYTGTPDPEELINNISPLENGNDEILKKDITTEAEISRLVRREINRQTEIYKNELAYQVKNLVQERENSAKDKNMLLFTSAFTSSHSFRVAQGVNTLSNILTPWEKIVAKLMALEHDKGKIGIYREILEKNGKLDTIQSLIMSFHPIISSLILNGNFNKIFMPGIIGDKYHHERYAGGGYISGKLLFQEDIVYLDDDPQKPIRINLILSLIQVADLIDAKLSKRPYKDHEKLKIVSEELIKNCFTQFHPLAVEAFYEMYASIYDNFSRNGTAKDVQIFIRNYYLQAIKQLNQSSLAKSINEYIALDIDPRKDNYTAKKLDFRKYFMEKVINPFFVSKYSANPLSEEDLNENYQKAFEEYKSINPYDLSKYALYSTFLEDGLSLDIVNYYDISIIAGDFLRTYKEIEQIEDRLTKISHLQDAQELFFLLCSLYYRYREDHAHKDEMPLLEKRFDELVEALFWLKKELKWSFLHKDEKIYEAMEYFENSIASYFDKLKTENLFPDQQPDIAPMIDKIIKETEKIFSESI